MNPGTQNEIFGKIKPPPGVPSGENALTQFLTFGIRMFFVLAGLAALAWMLWGAFDWITSSGDKEKVSKAQNKIQNAVVGVIVIFVIIGGVFTLEQVVFKNQFCFGLSCDLTLPKVGQ